MNKIKEKIAEHRMKKHGDESAYDNTYGETHSHNTHEHRSTVGANHELGEVVAERPVAVGVAEVPVVVTEQERVATEGHRHHEHHHEHHHVHEEVCGQKTFTEVEDRPVVRERVERIVEHRPVEKQFVVETKFVGEKEMGIAGADIVDVKERVVDVAQPGPACPVGTGAVMDQVVAGQTAGHTNTGGRNIL